LNYLTRGDSIEILPIINNYPEDMINEELLDAMNNVRRFSEADFKELLVALKYPNNEITLLLEFYFIIFNKTSNVGATSKLC
jgi:hypothetical protein